MDLQALRDFNLVAIHGGFGRAARATRRPKATLSRKVSELEQSLNVRLIERGSRVLRLTDEGVALHEATRGPLQDIGVYCINAARHIFAEEPIEAMAMAHRPGDDPRFSEVDASVAAMLRFPSGGLAQFIASFGTAEVDSYHVIGTLGDLTLDPGFRFETATKLRLRRDGKTIETQYPQIDHFGAQVAYFSDCITAGSPPEADGEEGLADMRALIAIERAVSTGRPQPISSPPRTRHPTLDMVRRAAPTDKRLDL